MNAVPRDERCPTFSVNSLLYVEENEFILILCFRHKKVMYGLKGSNHMVESNGKIRVRLRMKMIGCSIGLPSV